MSKPQKITEEIYFTGKTTFLINIWRADQHPVGSNGEPLCVPLTPTREDALLMMRTWTSNLIAELNQNPRVAAGNLEHTFQETIPDREVTIYKQTIRWPSSLNGFKREVYKISIVEVPIGIVRGKVGCPIDAIIRDMKADMA